MAPVFFKYRLIWTLIRLTESIGNKIELTHLLSHLNPDSQFLKLFEIIGNNRITNFEVSKKSG